MRRAAIALAALAIATSARAASVAIVSFAGSTPIISVGGPIALGDEVKFSDFAQALRYPAIVQLSSVGGSTIAALAIGRAIAKGGFSTYVADGEMCASACGLMWLAGRQRYSGPTSHIGLHATFLAQEGKNVETSPGNALVGKYLGELGYQDDFVVYATSAPPDGMYWLNRAVTDHFNITWEMRDQGMATLSTLDFPPHSIVPAQPDLLASTPKGGAPAQIAPASPDPYRPFLPPTPAPPSQQQTSERPQAPRRAPVKPPPARPRTLQDDVTDFFFGPPSTEQQPLARRRGPPATE